MYKLKVCVQGDCQVIVGSEAKKLEDSDAALWRGLGSTGCIYQLLTNYTTRYCRRDGDRVGGIHGIHCRPDKGEAPEAGQQASVLLCSPRWHQVQVPQPGQVCLGSLLKFFSVIPVLYTVFTWYFFNLENFQYHIRFFLNLKFFRVMSVLYTMFTNFKNFSDLLV